MLAPVHRSNLDFILVSALAPTRMRYMGKASIWKWKWGGKFVSMLGAFPVHRGSADREALRSCLEVIENGEPLVMFPEGTRAFGAGSGRHLRRPRLHRRSHRCAPGAGGDRWVGPGRLPVGSRLIRPHKVVLVVGEPIAPPPGNGSGRVRRRVVRELTEELRVSVQALYDEARRLAG